MNHELDIRRADISELDLILEWRMRVLREVFAHCGLEIGPALREANRKYYERSLPDGSNISCFASREGRIIGCGALCLLREMPSPDNPGGLVGFLMNIFVEPESRGQGCGARIVSWLLDAGRSAGVSRFMLETTDLGRSVYEAQGFRMAGGYMILDERPENLLNVSSD